MKVNYRSDFDFILKLYSAMTDSSGKEVENSRRELGWPDYDWVATFWTSSKANAYVASCIGGKCSNCYNDNGQIHIVVDDHHMGSGRLKVEFRAELPREIYPDGYQQNVIPEPLGIELVPCRGDFPSEIEAELLLPYIKGKPFTYEDFTEAQIADLKRPATEAAERADAALSAAEEATAQAVATTEKLAADVAAAAEAEAERIAAEEDRRSAESERQKAEQTRQTKERERQNSETLRVSAESARTEAESARQTAESRRASAEDARAKAETVRATDEQARKTAETSRETNESARAAAESDRVSKETARQSAESTRRSNESARVSAETSRVEAEQNRATEFASWETEINELKNRIAALEAKRVILLED